MTLYAVGLALLSSFPSLDLAWSGEFETDWHALDVQLAAPFTPGDYAAGSHQAKLAFRLTLPVVFGGLGLGRLGLIATMILAGVAIVYLTLTLTYLITRGRVAAALAAFAVATTYGVAGSFCDIRGIFDGVGIALLLASMLARSNLLVGVCVFLASFVDERCLAASSFVLIWRLLPEVAGLHGGSSAGKVLQALTRGWGILLAWGAYAGSRIALTRTFGLHTPLGEGGVSLRTLAHQVHGIPLGVWTALEGLWIIVAAAGIHLVWARRWVLLGALGASLGLVLGIANCVFDVTRSAVYVLPVVFIAIAVLQPREPRASLRTVLLMAAAICVLAPTYYTAGGRYIHWLLPMPLQLLRWIVGR